MTRLGLGCRLSHPWVEKAKLNLFEFFSPQIKNEARLNKNTAPRDSPRCTSLYAKEYELHFWSNYD